jgi:O-antigen/teichoic acid export membrane protein
VANSSDSVHPSLLESTDLPAAPSAAPSGSAVARASALNLFARVMSGAAALGTAVITTNVLSTHDRGIYAILTTWVGIAATMLTGGTPVLAADLIYGRRDAATLHGASLAIAAAATSFLVPLCLLVSTLTGGATSAALVFAAAVTGLVTYSNFVMCLDQARGDVLRVSLTGVGMSLFPLAALLVVSVLLDATVTSLMAAWAVGAVVTASAQLVSGLSPGSLSMRSA